MFAASCKETQFQSRNRCVLEPAHKEKVWRGQDTAHCRGTRSCNERVRVWRNCNKAHARCWSVAFRAQNEFLFVFLFALDSGPSRRLSVMPPCCVVLQLHCACRGGVAAPHSPISNHNNSNIRFPDFALCQDKSNSMHLCVCVSVRDNSTISRSFPTDIHFVPPDSERKEIKSQLRPQNLASFLQNLASLLRFGFR